MSGRLKLRRGVVVSADPLTVEVDGERRPAWADTALLGEMREGDEVVVNVAALDLGLGSGGFDVVHVNLTRGLEGGGAPGDEHVMKLNYTSLQHPVEPVEAGLSAMRRQGARKRAAGRCRSWSCPCTAISRRRPGRRPRRAPGIRVGYVQTGGGALPGSLSRDVAELRERGLLCGHITAAPAYGGEHEAISASRAPSTPPRGLGWDAVLVGPGPGIIGSDTEFGHGGMAALDSAHAALSLGLPTLLSPRLSSATRANATGRSATTRRACWMLLGGVEVAVPSGGRDSPRRSPK